MRDEVLGVILAGGQSRRMEGEEKSLLSLGNQKLIERVSARFSEQVENLIINANGDYERFAFMNFPVKPDTIDGFAGPLAGVLAGMRWAQENSKHTWVLTVAADTPFFPRNYARQMLGSVPGKMIALASSQGRKHPVFGLWHTSLADDLDSFLRAGNRKVMLFVEKHSNCIVDFPVKLSDPFFNVNTKDDLLTAERMLSEDLVDG